MGSMNPRVATYTEFKNDVLPRIKRLGYNAVQFMAIAEHAHYGSFGYHVTSFFAPASRSGTPEELKELIDAAHGHGLTVLMDLVHAHCSSNQIDGIAAMDGTDHCYTHGGRKGKQEQWDSSLFHYTKWEVLRFLLSNVRWWLDEYGFDGFRFDGVTSMLYQSHGIGKGYSGGYHEYFGMDADIESHVYLMLANDLIHSLLPNSGMSVAEDVSGMPTLCRPVTDGGFGFDYRLAMAVPDMWIKFLKECPDEAWNLGHIAHTLQNRRWKEPCIAYAESHDQAIVGDKTTAFWLMDAAMYTDMSTMGPPSMAIDRGLALHKMIRLVTMGLGGEGYLNFMGNEFGHPEWVDFPTEANGWSYQHCRRRFDMPDMDHLKYKFFESFDEVMQALDARFKFVSAPHQYCSRKKEDDKVLVFERGDCLFVINLHPNQSFSDYKIGHPWNEPLKVVMDSDEGRFGGQTRLEWGHANAYPPGEGWDDRNHSVQLYLPSRTAQVLVRDSQLAGGITLRLAAEGWTFPTSELRLAVVGGDGEVCAPLRFEGSVVKLEHAFASFKVWREMPDGSQATLELAPPVFKAHFPGDYFLTAKGNLTCLGGAGSALPSPNDGVPAGCTKALAALPGKTRAAADSVSQKALGA
jgi:1,4-alpha-glucan branching enzyme